eukprot:TRINITY_DN4886_c0_g1_i1.p1 TRINITY_DN4886_c0_g1~~TRINITY_DN4886_c0_g1_i1.p1  ORF type:complete len:309 (+),score=77.48 TRINITY_DN4886_c0_g1_i1:20-946(+)
MEYVNKALEQIQPYLDQARPHVDRARETLQHVRQEYFSLPSRENPEAEELRQRIAERRREHQDDLARRQAQVAAKEVEVEQTAADYEARAKPLLDHHDDMLQFKYLSQEMVDVSRKQEDRVRELLGDEYEGYCWESQAAASQLLLTQALNEKARAGLPFHEELKALTGQLVPESAVHTSLRQADNRGVASIAQLSKRFAELYSRAEVAATPGSNLVGRVWSKFTPSSAEHNDLFATREALIDGNVPAASEALGRWVREHQNGWSDSAAAAEAKREAHDFLQQLHLRIRADTLLRFTNARMQVVQATLV